MHRAGLNVPPGFCVTTDAYRVAVAPIAEDIIHEAAGTNSHAARELILKQEVPRAVRDAVVEAYRALGSPVVAVRSSATTEDLDSASFAGQQDTYLGVQGEESVVDALRRCWASLWTDRAVAYLEQPRNRGIICQPAVHLPPEGEHVVDLLLQLRFEDSPGSVAA